MAYANELAKSILKEIEKQNLNEYAYVEVMQKYGAGRNSSIDALKIVANLLKEKGINAVYHRGKLRIIK